MSLDIRYLTNGKKTLYTVINSGVTPIQRNVYKTKEEIPSDIRHYAPDGEPKFVGPDLAYFLGVGSFFYPGFPNCTHPEYCGTRCIAECCNIPSADDWMNCRYFPGYVMKGDE